MKNFVKISDYWYEYDSTSPEFATRIIDEEFSENFLVDIRDLEKAEANRKEELDWNNTIILDNRYKTGWISPDGVFYGCEAYYHKKQARLVHKKHETKLEEEGWIRINYIYHKNGDKSLFASFYSEDETLYPTREQLNCIYRTFPEDKTMYYNMWHLASERKQAIQQSWGLY